ncbi:MAG: hypothetical protein IKP97_00335 [Kiritimatiellae bacterium]|nr:hypothetical protein [Kiritimatiellia bacterium]
MAIGTVEFDLSMAHHETGEILTARSYTVAGVTNDDGSLRELSIGQLVMAICLQRASELETSIIALMEEMNSTSELLADLTDIEQNVVDEFQNNRNGHAYSLDGKTAPSGKTYLEIMRELGIMNNSQYYVRNDAVYSEADILYDDFISQVESKMDEKNSFSQQKMIELQSITNKRDQSYDMISNILKSLNTQIIGNVNNF